MKKILSILAFFAFVVMSKAQINSSGGQVYISEDALSSYTNPTICVSPTFDFRVKSWILKCTVGCVGDSYPVGVGELTLIFSDDEIDAYTPTAGTETEEILDVCNQAVKAYFEGISLNSGITFTL